MDTPGTNFSPHLGEVARAFWCGEPSCAGLPFGGKIYSILFYSTPGTKAVFSSLARATEKGSKGIIQARDRGRGRVRVWVRVRVKVKVKVRAWGAQSCYLRPPATRLAP